MLRSHRVPSRAHLVSPFRPPIKVVFSPARSKQEPTSANTLMSPPSALKEARVRNINLELSAAKEVAANDMHKMLFIMAVSAAILVLGIMPMLIQPTGLALKA